LQLTKQIIGLAVEVPAYHAVMVRYGTGIIIITLYWEEKLKRMTKTSHVAEAQQ
jgi:hypothetical protein